ncbi:MAG: helix-turn-helix transcriptional regulator [Polyangiaceae bacterium]
MRHSSLHMPFLPSPDCVAHVVRAQMALGLGQGELADKLETSRRTVTRWIARESVPSTGQLQTLARLVHPVNPAVAAELATHGGTTLVALGLERLAPSAEAPAPSTTTAPSPPPRPFPPARLMVESIVCAAAEAMGVVPSGVRGVLRAAFARARALGLTTEEVDDALSEVGTAPGANDVPGLGSGSGSGSAPGR